MRTSAKGPGGLIKCGHLRTGGGRVGKRVVFCGRPLWTTPRSLYQLFQESSMYFKSTACGRPQGWFFADVLYGRPLGHCTSCFKRAVCISSRPRVDVHKTGGKRPCGQGAEDTIFFCL